MKGEGFDNLLVSKADAMFATPEMMESVKLTDTTKNEIQSTIKEIDEIEQKNLSSMENKITTKRKARQSKGGYRKYVY